MGAWSVDTDSAAFFSHELCSSSVAHVSGDSVLGDVPGVALDAADVGFAAVVDGCGLVSGVED